METVLGLGVSFIMTIKILVITNMYPSKNSPSSGVFVKKMTQQLKKNKEYQIGLWVIPDISNKFIAYFFFYLFFIFKIFTFRPEVIHCHFVSHTGLLGVFAKKLLGCKLLLNCHGSDVMNSLSGNSFKYKLNNYLFGIADKIIVPSNFLQAIVSKEFNVEIEKTFIYPSGGVFVPKEKIGIYDKSREIKTIKIGYVGRLTESKGIKVLSKALSNLDIGELYVAGGGDISLLEKNLNSNVVLKYFGEVSQKELRGLYDKIDILIFPTLMQESLGLTPIEAMAYHVPVIGSNIGAVPEYVINGETGFLVNPGNVNELESAILIFKQMAPDDVLKLKANARIMAESYDEKNICLPLTKLINELV